MPGLSALVVPAAPTRRFLAVALFFALLNGCTDGTVYDNKAMKLSRQDFADLVKPPKESAKKTETLRDAAPGSAEDAAAGTGDTPPPIPELYDHLSAPPVPPLANNPRVTVSVNESIPLKDVLFELGRQAGVDMEIDPRIAGGIVFSARDRPFLDVIDRITDLAGLRYEAEDNAVRVELDEPFIETYRVPSLAQNRTLQSASSINTGLTTQQNTGGSGLASNANITINADSDIFAELETALESVLRSTAPRGLNQLQQPNFTIGRQAGVVTVYGNREQQNAARRLIDGYNQLMGAQALIEARVIEVTLDDNAETGIDWSAITEIDGIGNVGIDKPLLPTGATAASAVSNVVELTVDGTDVDAVVQFAERFGTVRTLSSPRLTVLNNHNALLKVAENFVYFRLDVDIEQGRDNLGNPVGELEIAFDSNVETVPIGFLMSVQPAIDLEKRQITLTLRPTVTQITGFVPDPAVRLTLADTDLSNIDPSSIPIIDIREIDSVMRVNSGSVAVLGGLMQQRAVLDDEGVPGLREAEVVNLLTGTRENTSELVELVVLLRARIVEDSVPDNADRRLYRNFVQDPRPITF